MDAFESLGNNISDLLKSGKKRDPVDKQGILNLVDNNLITLRLITDTYENNPTILTYIQTLIGASSISKDNTTLKNFYQKYFTGLNPVGRQLENSGILKSVYTVAKLVIADHQAIRDNFDLLFKDGTDVGDITIEQMKLSHATILGFINLSNIFADWFSYLIGQLVGQPGESVRIPPYRLAIVGDSSSMVADFVNDVLLRGSTQNIIALVQSVKKTGDVSLYTGSTTLNSYTNIKDYPGISRFIGSFNAWQPILWVRELFSRLYSYNYKRNLILREWVQTKIIILRMDADKLDPLSLEYQRQIRILQKYSDELAKLDRKIADYEKS